MARNAAQPSCPDTLIGDAIAIAESVRTAADSVFCFDPMQQHHADLRTESGPQVYGVLDGIGAAFRQIQWSQLRINFLEVGDRRYASGFERLDGDDILDAGEIGRASCRERV